LFTMLQLPSDEAVREVFLAELYQEGKCSIGEVSVA
jgi:hypothetical protein